MKKIKFLNGMNAVFALAVVALATTFTSCEKEEFNVNVTPINAQATISPIVLSVENGITTDVTSQATITPTTLSFTGTPALAAKDVEVTATYNGLTTKVTVKIPALQAGQFATLTPTIILQKITTIVADPQETTDVKKETGNVDNTSNYWYYTNVKYVVKSGNKVLENTKVINTTDLTEIAAINSFFGTLKDTYKEEEKTMPEVKVYAQSRTSATVTYTIVKTDYKIVRKAVTKADGAEVVASMTVENYATSTLLIEDNLQIPGHNHAPAGHGHGHGHGDDNNAGGGIVIPD